MAAIDFPPSPNNGDTFTPPGLDTVYVYLNGVWTGAVESPEVFLRLTGGDMTGDVLFKSGATQKILLSTSGNANFAGDVVVDGTVTASNITSVTNAHRDRDWETERHRSYLHP